MSYINFSTTKLLPLQGTIFLDLTMLPTAMEQADLYSESEDPEWDTRLAANVPKLKKKTPTGSKDSRTSMLRQSAYRDISDSAQIAERNGPVKTPSTSAPILARVRLHLKSSSTEQGNSMAIRSQRKQRLHLSQKA